MVAVPELASYDPRSGIGRVLHSLRQAWGEQVQLVEAAFKRCPLPVLRNFPYGVRSPQSADLVLLPKLTGAQALGRIGGLPSLAIVHDIGVVDCEADRASVDWLTRLSILQSLRGLHCASAIIADSHFTGRRLLQHMPDLKGRLSVVPLGVDQLFLKYDTPREAARNRTARLARAELGSPLLIYVGTEVPRKNLPLLLEAFWRLKQMHARAQLLKVGAAGGERWRAQTLRHIAALGLRPGDDVLFLEGLNDEALADAYRAADVFVSASLYEGFGLPALEAMAVGTPVIVSDRGALPEVVGAAGCISVLDPDQFLRGIESCLKRSMGADYDLQSRSHAAQYRWERAAQAYLAIVQRLLQDRTGPSKPADHAGNVLGEARYEQPRG